MRLPNRVTMIEVGARDGLQNEPATVPTETKVALIDRLAGAGLSVVEAGSFVPPKWIPQMADTADVLAGLGVQTGVDFSKLVDAGRFFCEALGRKPASKVALAVAAKNGP